MLWKAMYFDLASMGRGLSEGNLRDWFIELGVGAVSNILQQLYDSHCWVKDNLGVIASGGLEGLKGDIGQYALPLIMGLYFRVGSGGLLSGLRGAVEGFGGSGFLREEGIRDFLVEVRGVYSRAVRGEDLKSLVSELRGLVERHLSGVFPLPAVREHIFVVASDVMRIIATDPAEAWGLLDAAARAKGEGRRIVLLLDDDILEGLFRIRKPEDRELLRKFIPVVSFLSRYMNAIGGSGDTSIYRALAVRGLLGVITPSVVRGSYFPVFRAIVEKGEREKGLDLEELSPEERERIANEAVEAAMEGGDIVPFDYLVHVGLISHEEWRRFKNRGATVRLIVQAGRDLLGYKDIPVTLPEDTRRNMGLFAISYPLRDLLKVLDFLVLEVGRRGRLVVEKDAMPNLFMFLRDLGYVSVESGVPIETVTLGSSEVQDLAERFERLAEELENYGYLEVGGEVGSGQVVFSRERTLRMLDEFPVIWRLVKSIFGSALGQTWSEFFRRLYGIVSELVVHLADNRREVDYLIEGYHNLHYQFQSHTGMSLTGLFSTGEYARRKKVGGGVGIKADIRNFVLSVVGEIPEAEVEQRVNQFVNFVEALYGIGEEPLPGDERAKWWGKWTLAFGYVSGRDPKTGKRRINYHSFLGLGYSGWVAKVNEWRRMIGEGRHAEVLDDIRRLVLESWYDGARRVTNSIVGRLTEPENWGNMQRAIMSALQRRLTGQHISLFSEVTTEEGRPLEERVAVAGPVIVADKMDEALWVFLEALAKLHGAGRDLYEGAEGLGLWEAFASYLGQRPEAWDRLNAIIGKIREAVREGNIMGDLWELENAAGGDLAGFLSKLDELLGREEVLDLVERETGYKREQIETAREARAKGLRRRREGVPVAPEEETAVVEGEIEEEVEEATGEVVTEVEEDRGRVLIKFRLLSWLSS